MLQLGCHTRTGLDPVGGYHVRLLAVALRATLLLLWLPTRTLLLALQQHAWPRLACRCGACPGLRPTANPQ